MNEDDIKWIYNTIDTLIASTYDHAFREGYKRGYEDGKQHLEEVGPMFPWNDRD